MGRSSGTAKSYWRVCVFYECFQRKGEDSSIEKASYPQPDRLYSYLHLVVHTAHLGPHCGLRDMPEVLTGVLRRKKRDRPRASGLRPEHILQAHSESVSMYIRRPEANYSPWMLGSKHWLLKFLAYFWIRTFAL